MKKSFFLNYILLIFTLLTLNFFFGNFILDIFYTYFGMGGFIILIELIFIPFLAIVMTISSLKKKASKLHFDIFNISYEKKLKHFFFVNTGILIGFISLLTILYCIIFG